MSMTGKTTNELFPVGQNTDTVSIFDLNVITEKADSLIHALQGKDSLTARELEEVKTKLTQLTQGLTTVTQTSGTNATNIASLQNLIDSLIKSLTPQVILPNIETCAYGVLNFRTVLKYGKLIIAPFSFNCKTTSEDGIKGLGSYLPKPFNAENTITTMVSNGVYTCGLFSVQENGMLAFRPNGTNHNERTFNGTMIYITSE